MKFDHSSHKCNTVISLFVAPDRGMRCGYQGHFPRYAEAVLMGLALAYFDVIKAYTSLTCNAVVKLEIFSNLKKIVLDCSLISLIQKVCFMTSWIMTSQ